MFREALCVRMEYKTFVRLMLVFNPFYVVQKHVPTPFLLHSTDTEKPKYNFVLQIETHKVIEFFVIGTYKFCGFYTGFVPACLTSIQCLKYKGRSQIKL